MALPISSGIPAQEVVASTQMYPIRWEGEPGTLVASPRAVVETAVTVLAAGSSSSASEPLLCSLAARSKPMECPAGLDSRLALGVEGQAEGRWSLSRQPPEHSQIPALSKRLAEQAGQITRWVLAALVQL